CGRRLGRRVEPDDRVGRGVRAGNVEIHVADSPGGWRYGVDHRRRRRLVAATAVAAAALVRAAVVLVIDDMLAHRSPIVFLLRRRWLDVGTGHNRSPPCQVNVNVFVVVYPPGSPTHPGSPPP